MSENRDLGPIREGTGHWWAQRLSAVALVPLGLWIVVSLAAIAGADYAVASAWLKAPFTLGAMPLFLGAALYHAVLGLNVVIEDYVHHQAAKIALVLLVRFIAYALMATAAVSLLTIAFGA